MNAERPEEYQRQLALSDRAAARGARVVPLSVPHAMEFFVDLVSPFFFGALPGFGDVMTLPLEARRRALADPACRAKIKPAVAEALGGPVGEYVDFARMEIARTFEKANAGLVGRVLGDVARERGLDPVDALLDVALADGLRTLFVPVRVGDDDASWKIRVTTLMLACPSLADDRIRLTPWRPWRASSTRMREAARMRSNSRKRSSAAMPPPCRRARTRGP